MAKAKRVESIRDVPNAVIAKFEKAVEKLANEMIPTDFEGMPAVQTLVVDRRHFEALYYEPVPYSAFVNSRGGGPLNRSAEDKRMAHDEDRLAMLTYNAKIANHELEVALDSMRRDIVRRREAAKKAKAK